MVGQDAESVAGADRRGGFGHGDDVERVVAAEFVGDGEDFKRTGEVEDFDVGEEEEGDGSFHGRGRRLSDGRGEGIRVVFERGCRGFSGRSRSRRSTEDRSSCAGTFVAVLDREERAGSGADAVFEGIAVEPQGVDAGREFAPQDEPAARTAEAREQGKQKAGAFYGAGGTRVTGGCGCKLRWCLEYGSGGVGRKLKQSARERGR